MSNDLAIYLKVLLQDKTKSNLTTEIETLVKNIQQKLGNLTININSSSISNLVSQLEKLNEFTQNNNKSSTQNIQIIKELDGTVKKYSETVKANGEIIQKTTEIIDKNKTAKQQATKATDNINKEAEAVDKLITKYDKLIRTVKIKNANKEVLRQDQTYLNSQTGVKTTVVSRPGQDNIYRTDTSKNNELLKEQMKLARESAKLAKESNDYQQKYYKVQQKALTDEIKLQLEKRKIIANTNNLQAKYGNSIFNSNKLTNINPLLKDLDKISVKNKDWKNELDIIKQRYSELDKVMSRNKQLTDQRNKIDLFSTGYDKRIQDIKVRAILDPSEISKLEKQFLSLQQKMKGALSNNDTKSFDRYNKEILKLKESYSGLIKLEKERDSILAQQMKFNSGLDRMSQGKTGQFINPIELQTVKNMISSLNNLDKTSLEKIRSQIAKLGQDAGLAYKQLSDLDKAKMYQLTTGSNIKNLENSNLGKHINDNPQLLERLNIIKQNLAMTNLLDKETQTWLNNEIALLNKDAQALNNVANSQESIRKQLNTKSQNALNLGVKFGNLSPEQLAPLEKALARYKTLISEMQQKNLSGQLVSDKDIERLQRLENAIKRVYDNTRIASRDSRGFNFEQYPKMTNAVQGSTVAQNYYNQSIMHGKKLLEANVQETEKYIKVTQRLREGSKITSVTAYVNKLNGETYKFSESMRDLMRRTWDLGSAFKTAFEKIGLWAGATGIFYGVANSLQQMGREIINVDTKLTELSKVLDNSTNWNKLMLDTAESANTMARSLTEALDAELEFGKMFAA